MAKLIRVASDESTRQRRSMLTIAFDVAHRRGLGLAFHTNHISRFTGQPHGMVGEVLAEVLSTWKHDEFPPTMFHESIPTDQCVPYDPINYVRLTWADAVEADTGLGRLERLYVGDYN